MSDRKTPRLNRARVQHHVVWIGAALAVVLMVGCATYYLNSVTIQQVEVSGAEHASVPMIMDLSGVAVGDTLFRLDADLIASRVDHASLDREVGCDALADGRAVHRGSGAAARCTHAVGGGHAGVLPGSIRRITARRHAVALRRTAYSRGRTRLTSRSCTGFDNARAAECARVTFAFGRRSPVGSGGASRRRSRGGNCSRSRRSLHSRSIGTRRFRAENEDAEGILDAGGCRLPEQTN